MENTESNLFEAGLLSEDVQASLQEAFEARIAEAKAQAFAEAKAQALAEAKVELRAEVLEEAKTLALQEARVEAKAQAEVQIREEMAQRYEHDKATLVEAMDRMLTDVVQKVESERATHVSKLKEAQARYASATKELRGAYKTKVQEHAQVLEQFVMTKLNRELVEFEEDKTALKKARDAQKARLQEQMRVMESFVVGKLTRELKEFAEDKNAVAAMRVKYANVLAENKATFKKRMQEHMGLMRKFVVEKLEDEIVSLRKSKTELNRKQAVLEAEAATQRAQLEEQYAARLKKMDKFVVGQVAKELREFQEDKNALVQKRVQLVAESKKKLAETQRSFVKEAAKLVDQKVTETMKVELKQLHEDLERNRQNMFGRRIFEAVASEFMSSYFSEGAEVKKLEKVLESQKTQLAAMQKQLKESQQASEAAARKAKLAEDSAARAKTMSELLGPLARDKRTVMEELLESVKTTQLREAYHKYLPAVLNEGSKKTAPQSRQTLSEAPVKEKEKRTVAITGDQRNNRLLETVKAENKEASAITQETADILKLAGIKK